MLMRDEVPRIPVTARLRARAGRLLGDRGGAGAIEFAFIAPMLLVAYLGAFEASVGFSVSRKTARAAATISDLLTQSTLVSVDTLDGMPHVVRALMAPYVAANVKMKITGIAVDSSGQGQVRWSRDEAGGTPYAKDSSVSVPQDGSMDSSFVVRTELSVPYRMKMLDMMQGKGQAGAFSISKTYYYRQRVGSGITCSDCP
ncbi:hypothetical protein BJF92_24195 [Rhizobium rhizosphaerae]|uniref:TadE-like domain-containing protein n=2 Tax=Xaviernesmea rhizosphaerae TaxID=1672749 RepID=A0A1Q9AQ29_9HYPH|nr:hypothetical protein BJF92_24195 [Xaviernesmea rhizosphaerae]